jgi:pimeloyl-ACP methyl ester carboxylesterase
MASVLASGIRGSKMVVIPDALHIATVEAPVVVNNALKAFIEKVKVR